MIKNKTILVTGAASGIGKETAAHLKEQGARVIWVDINDAAEVDTFLKWTYPGNHRLLIL